MKYFSFARINDMLSKCILSHGKINVSDFPDKNMYLRMCSLTRSGLEFWFWIFVIVSCFAYIVFHCSLCSL